MNHQIFQRTGGFPLTTNRLDFLQASLLLMQNFGEIAGDKTIISGCEVRGSQVTPGMMFIDGELIPFIGGQLSDYVVIRESRVQKMFEDGYGKEVEVIRDVMFGNGLTRYAWSAFTRIKPIKILQKALTPIGAVIIWPYDEDSTPEGWYPCDGRNGRPNFNDLYLIGAKKDNDGDYEQVGQIVGGHEVTLQGVNMPPHNHGGQTGSDTHSHTYQKAVDGRGYKTAADDTPYSSQQTATTSSDAHSHMIASDGGLNGVARPFDNRPRSKKVIYIIYTGE